MLEVQSCLKEGCRRAVGDGNETMIGSGPWLPVDENPYVETDLHQSVYEAPVSFLMNMQVYGSHEISGFGIGTRRGHTLLNHVTGTLLWWLWTDDLGPEFGIYKYRRRSVEESGLHLFAFCPEAARLWSKLGMPQNSTYGGNRVDDWFFWVINTLHASLLPNFVMAVWGMWCSRNDSVWKWVVFYLNTVVQRALLFLDSWRSANEVQACQPAYIDEGLWSKPVQGRLKLNMDAALNENSNLLGFGWVLRDDNGNFLAAKNMLMPGAFMVKEAKALCIREALSWLKGTCMGGVDVEIDSQIVFNAISSPSFNAVFGFIVDDIKNLAEEIDDVKFCCVKRSANCAADSVAREAFSVSGCGEWLDCPPSFLVNVLIHDLMN
ncbi:PREDICTED: uncharacterized protein LOC109147197 [Ipomoea nil]|uniref:uncharacterized protein LOC109147197 n=1 Tax=Ipomoea nil TaxID=35883 RepID=UPI000901C701|nr:PREDICTED: uncharacterized protein LOC109147197 [Ipomoea nil]